MMTPEFFIEIGLNPALRMLPPVMDSAPARAEVMAIGMQESLNFAHREQIQGPAKGFFQFEMGGGVRGVLMHDKTKDLIKNILAELGYDFTPFTSYSAIQHNDILAAAYARLYLWQHPRALPQRGQYDEGWNQYLETWRPNRQKARRDTWNAYFDAAWNLVQPQD